MSQQSSSSISHSSDLDVDGWRTDRVVESERVTDPLFGTTAGLSSINPLSDPLSSSSSLASRFNALKLA